MTSSGRPSARRAGLLALVLSLVLPGIAAAAPPAELAVDCDVHADDITAVQQAVDFPSATGRIVRLSGTCDFTAAAAHGGDLTSIEAAAVIVRASDTTVESAGTDRAIVVGSGTQTAFFVAPGTDSVVIRGLKLVSFGRPLVAVNTAATTIGAPGGLPSPEANRIAGGLTMDSAIVGLAVDRGYGDSSGTLTIRFGTAGVHSDVFSIPPDQKLTGFRVTGNYVTYAPPGVPDGDTGVVAVDVRERYGRVADGIEITSNAVGLFSSDFPSFDSNGIRVQALSTDLNAPTPDGRHVRNVLVARNNLGRLEEVDGLDPDGVDPADAHASGRAAVVLLGVGAFEVSSNSVRAKLSPTVLPMPGGGIVASDSADGTISSNGVIVLTADASTLSGDLGAIGLVDDLLTLFSENAGPPEEGVVVTDNVVGPAGTGPPGIGSQRGLLLNGTSRVTLGRNNVKFSSAAALNIGTQVSGPGSLSNPGTRTLARAVYLSVSCQNFLDGTEDDPYERDYNQGIGSAGNSFPAGWNYAGGSGCTPRASASPPAVGAGGSLTISGTAWPARPVTVRLSGPPSGTELIRTFTSGNLADFSTVFTAQDLSVFQDGTLCATALARDDLGSGLQKISAEACATKATVPPAAPVITSPAEGAALPASWVYIAGTARANATVRIWEQTVERAQVQAEPSGSFSTWASFSEGPHVITATATDEAGNVSAPSAPRSFTVDTVAPAAPVITSPTEGAVVPSTSVAIAGTAEPLATVVVKEGTDEIDRTASLSDGSWQVETTLAEGPHTVRATATDAAGNSGPASAPRRFTVDTTGPVAPSISSPVEGAVLTSTTVTVAGWTEGNATIRVWENMVQIGETDATAAGEWTVPIEFAIGSHSITATATDTAGRTGPASDPRNFQIDPTATGIHPIATDLLPPPFSVFTGATEVAVSWKEATGGEPVDSYILVVARPTDNTRIWMGRVMASECVAGICSTTLSFPLPTFGGPMAPEDKYAVGVVTVFADKHRSDGQCDNNTIWGLRCGANISHPPGYVSAEFLITSKTWPAAYQDASTHNVFFVNPATGKLEFWWWNDGRVAELFAGTGLTLPVGTDYATVAAGTKFVLVMDHGNTRARGVLVAPGIIPRVVLFDGQRL